ncbi:MAG: hypothetical protein EZS28_030702 [Streblomastix strix]|uniref:DUF4371 domain-containing protein n=1 Tax=Streblomastix strix TaxID=222440 RepID=A0A5J4UUC1_9EUKA|nr:MAG: hypothetical protein EZS28_030702 [Streblomastix strix]
MRNLGNGGIKAVNLLNNLNQALKEKNLNTSKLIATAADGASCFHGKLNGMIMYHILQIMRADLFIWTQRRIRA